MKIVSIYRMNPETFAAGPPPGMHEKMGALIGELLASGELVDTGGVIPEGMSIRVRFNGNGSFAVTDGPFAESKEIIGGYALFNVPSRERAMELTERFLSVTGSGECELIEVSSAND